MNINVSGRKKDQGISVIELVAIVAIIAIIGGLSVYGLSMVSGKPAKQAAKKIQIILERDRTTSMGKIKTELFLYQGDDGGLWAKESVQYQQGGSLVSDEQVFKLADRGVEVFFCAYAEDVTYADSPLESLLVSEDNAVVIEFDRSSGSLKQPFPSGLIIYAVKGGSIYKITIEGITGKISVEREYS